LVLNKAEIDALMNQDPVSEMAAQVPFPGRIRLRSDRLRGPRVRVACWPPIGDRTHWVELDREDHVIDESKEISGRVIYTGYAIRYMG